MMYRLLRNVCVIAVLVIIALCVFAPHSLFSFLGFAAMNRFDALRPAVFTDFGQLERYRAEDKILLQSGADTKNRVVFFGDSIIDYWQLEDSFPDKHYVNRGISGQTTAQMVVRFRQDVINLHPTTVLILGSSNDLVGVTGNMQPEDSEANYASMIEMANANHIHVIIASILPVNNYNPVSEHILTQRPMEKIRQINSWLKNYCAAGNCTYLDYLTVMTDNNGLLKKELSIDGLHPNASGYAVMAPLAEAAIDKSSIH